MSVALPLVEDATIATRIHTHAPVAASSRADHRIADLNRRLVSAASEVKVLSRLSWPASAIQEFLDGRYDERRRLPKVDRCVPSYESSIAELRRIVNACDPSDPNAGLVARTAASYLDAAELLRRCGKRSFTAKSIDVYGSSASSATGVDGSVGDVARRILRSIPAGTVGSPTAVAAEEVARRLRVRLSRIPALRQIEVRVDDSLSAKAAAGAKRIRIRSGADFTEADVGQLLEHEAFVHSATVLNGRRQPLMRSLGLAPPRTTCLQEGLATLAEVATGVVDDARLRRLAHRTLAVEAALAGADFFDVLEFFRSHGESRAESLAATVRIFRGGDGRAGVVFTKDSVYLRGLYEVRHLLQSNRNPVAACRLLFCGRFSSEDVADLAQAVKTGLVATPAFVPAWVDKRTLSAATDRLDAIQRPFCAAAA